MGYNIVKYREECVSLQIHFHPDVFMDLFSDSLRDNQLYFLLDLTLGQKKVGFGSLQHFSKVFKNTMNISLTKFFSHPPL